jgi:hypothetical protein
LNAKIHDCAIYAVAAYLLQQISFQYFVDPSTDVLAVYPGFILGIYRMSHELRSLLRESVPYVKIYRYNPKYLCPKLNGYGDNG